MAKFLNTEGITNHIRYIMKDAREKLIIISPYLTISKEMKEVLELRGKQGLSTIIIYGKKKKLKKDEKEWIKSQNEVELLFCKPVHAKCYFNEKEAVICSMNLYEYSQKNNYEMGVFISKKDDASLYDSMVQEADKIRSGSIIKKKALNGFCIRCKSSITFNIKFPYCKEDGQVWKKYNNKSFEERSGFCHICGKSNKSSMEKPVCISCYNKNKFLFKTKK